MIEKIKHNIHLALRENIPLSFATLFCVFITLCAIPYIPKDFDFNNSLFNLYYTSWNSYTFAVTAIYVILFGLSLLGIDNKGKIKRTITSQNIISGLIASINIFVCLYCFCLFKRLIPFINPFSWDPFFFKLDSMLLGGSNIFMILEHFSSTQTLKTVCDICYVSWAATSGVIILWQHISPNRKIRMQYLTAWVATWAILGSIAAVTFSSVGPCFYSNFYPNTPALIANSNQKLKEDDGHAEYTTDTTKKLLLETVSQEKNSYLGFAISAFPSLHIGTTVLNACLISKVSPKLKWLVWLYVFLMAISCTYLGFHYLVDCFGGAIGAILIWKFVGIYIDRKMQN